MDMVRDSWTDRDGHEPFHEMVDCLWLLTFDFVTQEAEVVVKLACPGCVCDAMSIPCFGDTPPAFLFRLDLHRVCGNDANACCWPIGRGPEVEGVEVKMGR